MDYTVDLLIFGISSKENNNIRELSKKNLSIILVKRDKDPFNNMLVLPGGYVNKNETSEEAAKRVLEKETGLKDIQLYFSSISDDVKRDPRNRTISVSYLALVDTEKITNNLKENSSWYDVDYVINDDNINIKLFNENDNLLFTVERKTIDKKSNLEKYSLINKNKMGFDHELILTKGLMELRNKVKNTDIIFNLLPQKFTIGSLEQIFENILKEKIINSAFRRSYKDKLKVTNQMVKTGGHRPSYLYELKEKEVKKNSDELVDIYDPNTLKKTKETIFKRTAHSLGIWHSSVHLIIINKEKTKTLIQKRSSNKDLYPNMWDISVGGHISSNESDFDSVKRELNEELGLNSDKYEIELLKKYKEELIYKNIDNKEIVSIFIMYEDINIDEIKLQKSEVKDIKWVTKDELNSLIKDKKIIPHIEEYNIINDILK